MGQGAVCRKKQYVTLSIYVIASSAHVLATHSPCHGLVAFHIIAAERAFDACIRLRSCAQDAVSHGQRQLPVL